MNLETIYNCFAKTMIESKQENVFSIFQGYQIYLLSKHVLVNRVDT